MISRAWATTVIAAVLVVGCGASRGGNATSTSAPQASIRVDIRSFKFSPPTVIVKKGGTITWTNSDTAAHTATADDRSFDTKTINHGHSHTLAFTASGTLSYHCDFHPFMKAIVVVK